MAYSMMGNMTDESTLDPDDDATDDDVEAELAAKFAILRESTRPASEALDRLRGISGPGAEITAKLSSFTKREDNVVSGERVIKDLLKPDGLIDFRNMTDQRAARASEKTAEYMGVLVDAARDTERRETVMLRWTVVGVFLAAIAAITGIVAFLR